MMKMMSKADRFLKASGMIAEMRKSTPVTEVGRFMKWKEIPTGRISVSFDVYLANNRCIVADTLGMVASIGETLPDVLGWMKDHGYTPEKDWYMSNGMTEEAWEEWNNG